MTAEVTLRDVTPADGAGCAAIYAHYVEHTTATFEEIAPSVEEMVARIASHRSSMPGWWPSGVARSWDMPTAPRSKPVRHTGIRAK